MKVIVLNPWKVLLAGILSAVLVGASVLGALALAGVFSSERAQAYGADYMGSTVWIFAEGYTGEGFEEWILLYNCDGGISHGNHTRVKLYLYGENGPLGEHIWEGILIGGERVSLNINDLAATYYGYSGDVSAAVVAEEPIIAERAMYWDYKGKWQGGSTVPGYTESTDWVPPQVFGQ